MDAPDRPVLDELERELTRLFRGARASSARLAASVHPSLDAAGYVVLQWLYDQPGDARASDLADFLQLHKSTASRAIAELEGLGLLERAVDPADARARLLHLTEAGRTAVVGSRAGRRTHLAERLADWPADDVHRLAELLARLTDDLV